MQKTRLAQFRHDAGISLEQFGRMLTPPVDKSTVLRWERGVTPVPVKRMDEVERITGIDRHHLRPDIFGPSTAEPISSANDGGRATEASPCSPPPGQGEAAFSEAAE